MDGKQASIGKEASWDCNHIKNLTKFHNGWARTEGGEPNKMKEKKTKRNDIC